MASSSPTGSEPELVNHSAADIRDQSSTNAEVDSDQAERPRALTRQSTSALEKCWICLSTKDEDLPSPPNPPTAWRSPCSCSLQAHEACLLDWVADQESPRSRSGGGRSGPTPDIIQCPQCRSEIKLQRPVDPLVQLCRRLDKQYSRLVLPGLGVSLLGTILSGCWAHGRLATYLVFGREHDQQIFNWAVNSRRGHVYSYALIPLSLIFSRTRYADFVLPMGSIALFSTQLPQNLGGPFIDWDAPYWPPSASTFFVLLPTLKQFYDWSYEKCFGELNRKWIEEVMPRREEGYEGQEGNMRDILEEHEAELAEQAEDGGGGGGGMVLELEVNMNAAVGDEDSDDEDAQGAGNADDIAEHIHAAQHANANANGEAPRERGRVHQLLGDNELMDDTSSIGQMVIGSLLLPVVAAAAGDLLALALPASWISTRWNYYPASGRVGFFATKWGRSVAGGLAFCVLKDMLVTYCRWRLAEAHKKRKIMNFDKKEKKYVAVE
ncbi:hypothetical protein OHC33_003941 [Knufia fluminis]|uniref:RING-CH-type domain-containing protein n=1 Tax=Knufia fluminis TaxID=191047 RepID=A0AAN8EGI6_9EURO|nr:hypothetical protein OHC33_003941 [Knufia fluminis]